MTGAVPVMSSDRNYCVKCSPYGIPYGEPGEQCYRCGTPMQMSDEQVAVVRLIRNRLAIAKARGEIEPAPEVDGHPPSYEESTPRCYW